MKHEVVFLVCISVLLAVCWSDHDVIGALVYFLKNG